MPLIGQLMPLKPARIWGSEIPSAAAQTGALAGSLTITDELGVESVSLSGTGLQPGFLTVSPSSLTFSTQQPGVASASQTVTVTNSGGAAIANIGFQIAGPAAGSYSIGASTCGAVLGSGARCAVSVTFTPAATGAIAAALAISSSTPGVTAAQVQLDGLGQLGSGITITPSVLAFTVAIGVGQASSARSVTVTNSSGYTIGSVLLDASAPFSITANTCTGSLAAGATCTAGVLFVPTASGAAIGTLTVSSNGVAAPASVALSGTGFDFGVQPSGPSSITVSSGQQADYRLVITPSGAGGTFAFECGTLPGNAVCLFSSPTMTLSSIAPGYVEVQIYTGSSGQTAKSKPPDPGYPWPIAFALLLLPLVVRHRSVLLQLAALAVALGAGVSSRTSSSGGTTSSNGQNGATAMPAGTYSVPVTVTAAGVSHSVTLSLTVD